MASSKIILECEFELGRIESVARIIVAQISAGMNIGLFGELGAGKTTMVGAILRVLDSSYPVSSPTYVLEHHYSTNSTLQVQHWDLYRLAELPYELLEPSPVNTFRLIEWADKFPQLVRECDLIIELEFAQSTVDEPSALNETRHLRVSLPERAQS